MCLLLYTTAEAKNMILFVLPLEHKILKISLIWGHFVQETNTRKCVIELLTQNLTVTWALVNILPYENSLWHLYYILLLFYIKVNYCRLTLTQRLDLQLKENVLHVYNKEA